MDKEILQGIGLTEPQTNAYMALLKAGEFTPAELAAQIGETRTNTYAILKKLESAGIVRKDTSGKTLQYKPSHPVNLEAFVERRRNAILNWEYKLNATMPGLVRTYFETTEMGDVQFYHGEDGIKRVFDDILETKAELHLIMTPNQHDFLGADFVDKFVKDRVKRKITAHILAPKGSEWHNLRNDKAHLIDHSFYDASLYNSPVEVNIYGDKVAFLSYGDEVTATVIHSQQIAESQRQIFKMLVLASN